MSTPMAQSPKKKVIRITLELEVGDRKVWLSRIKGAYQLGTELMVEALAEALPEGAIVDVSSRMEWYYLYGSERNGLEITQGEQDGDSENGVSE